MLNTYKMRKKSAKMNLVRRSVKTENATKNVSLGSAIMLEHMDPPMISRNENDSVFIINLLNC